MHPTVRAAMQKKRVKSQATAMNPEDQADVNRIASKLKQLDDQVEALVDEFTYLANVSELGRIGLNFIRTDL